MSRRMLVAALIAGLVSACSVKSTPAWVRQLEACQEIKDEVLRVECITSLERHP